MPLSLDGNGPIGGITTQNGGQLAGMRNRLINGGFSINQRAVTGTVTLTAGSYGHDRFKAGASGCTYTFASSQNGNVLTISAGTLMQVIEGANLEGGTFVLSWFGTATARIDSGSYSASGVTGTAVAGTNQTVEFGTGTVGRVQYELGTVATTFEQRPIGMELELCQRYFWLSNPANLDGAGGFYGSFWSTSNFSAFVKWPVAMRVAPTIVRGGTRNNFIVPGISSTLTASTVTPQITPDGAWSEFSSASPASNVGYGASYNGQLSVSAEF